MADPRVFTIPASAPFLKVAIRALLDGTLIGGFPASHDPMALADATLYLPTRRACRLARDVFLDVTGGSAAILPRIVPIGDIDEDEIVFADAAAGEAALDLRDKLGDLERRLLLAHLVAEWAASPAMSGDGRMPLVANTPASALALADALARLMDDMTTRQVSWDALDTLVPDELDQYWQLTLKFLQIAREAWPPILHARNKMEPAARRDTLIEAERKRLQAETAGPVIAAGSTGSMPATAALIETIAKLPNGAVVLPGLDTDLDDDSWNKIAGASDAQGRETAAPAIGHPQFAMQALLKRIGIARADVRRLGEPAASGREAVVSEAMRPADSTDRWRGLPDRRLALDTALQNVSVIEAANAEEEALAIAVALREALENEGKTAALVTPDRALARRVLAALDRWKIAADDSGGDALADTPAGLFARLAAEAALDGLKPVTLLALLKHPLLRLGAAEGAHPRAIATLEMAVLRGPRPKLGTAGLQNALATFREELAKLRRKAPSAIHGSEPRARLNDAELDAAADLVARLATALAPLEELPKTRQPLTTLAKKHGQVIAALSNQGGGDGVAFAGPDGKALAKIFDEIADDAPDTGTVVAPADYADLFREIVAGRIVRRPGLPGVRVRIYGPLEARLQHIDRVVLGGLVEGVWPPETRSDPWLSRPMRRALGLDLPERRISLSAHDFAQMLGAGEIVLAYPARLAGAPTVISRFVQRLAAVAGESRWNEARARGNRYTGWARALDAPPAKIVRLPKPAPKPPLAARPKGLSVTDIENWLRDPYTIYAKHILKLREIDAVDLAPGAADRGIVIHGAIGEFTATYAGGLPDDPERVLVAIGEKYFEPLNDFPEARAFWWPRFLRIARWFAGWERERRGDIAAITAETYGNISIPLGKGHFTLSARADRIERLANGQYAILDYKTGVVPSEKQVRTGLSPQLTLEAAIVRGGGFKGIEPGVSVAELVYVSLKGGDPGGKSTVIDFKDGNANHHADRALAKLKEFATKFENPEQPYEPLVLSMWKNRYGSYDHLARVKEWSVGGDDDAEGGDA